MREGTSESGVESGRWCGLRRKYARTVGEGEDVGYFVLRSTSVYNYNIIIYIYIYVRSGREGEIKELKVDIGDRVEGWQDMEYVERLVV